MCRDIVDSRSCFGEFRGKSGVEYNRACIERLDGAEFFLFMTE